MPSAGVPLGIIAAAKPAGGAPFDPLSAVTWTVAHWASDPAWTPPADGAALASGWRDGSGNGRDVTQATAGQRPVYRASVTNLNSKPAVEFDGSDDTLVNSSGFTVTQTFSIVAVVSAWSSYGTGDTARLCSSNNGQVQLGHGYPGTNDVTMYGGGADHRTTSPATVIDTTSANLVHAVYSGIPSKIGVNGTLGTVTASPGNIGLGISWTIGARTDGWRPSAMKLAFLGVYSGDITSDANWTAFKSWVASYYGLTIS